MTKEQESAIILIKDLRSKIEILWKNNSNPIRLKYLIELRKDIEIEFKVSHIYYEE